MTYSEIKQVWQERMNAFHLNCSKVSEAMGHTKSSFWMAMNAKNDMFLANVCRANEALGLCLYIDGTQINSAQDALDWLWQAHQGKIKKHIHSKASCNQIWRWNNGKSAALYNGFREIIHELGYSMEVR